MNKQTLYLETLSIVFFVTILWLSFFREQRIEIYLSLFFIGYFGVTFVFHQRKRIFDLVGSGLFIIYGYFIVIYLIRLLTK